MKNFYFLLLTLGVVFASCTNEFENIADDSQAYVPNSPARVVKYVDQHQAIKAFNKLQEVFVEERVQTKSTNAYPSYYGGCYIDENANLVVCITGDSISARAKIGNMLGKNVITKYCKYSYQQLKDIMAQISRFADNNPGNPIIDNLAVISLRDKENNIVVKLLDCSEQKLSEFKAQVVNSPAVVFEEVAERVSTYASPCPGMKILANGGGGSLGYRVTRMGEVGYISSAHGVDLYDYVAVPTIGMFAYCTMWQYSGSVDASFLQDRASDYSPIIEGTSIRLDAYAQNVFTGLNVYKSGDATGVTSGWVTSSSTEIFTSDNVRLTDVAESNYNSAQGDSGGIVYCDVYGGAASIAGIVEGGNSVHSYFIKATNINAAFNCIPY